MNDIDWYGEDADYIHVKFGDLPKRYNFTEKFRNEHPVFVKEFEMYVDNNPESRFKDALHVVNYIDHWKLPIGFYFNYTEQPAKSNREVQEWLIREHMPQGFEVHNDGNWTGWDNESKVVAPDQILVIVKGQSKTFKNIKSLMAHVSKLEAKGESK